MNQIDFVKELLNEARYAMFFTFLFNAVFLGFNLKIYSEIMKEKSQRARKDL